MKAGGTSMRTCRWAALAATIAATGCGSSGGTTTSFASEQGTPIPSRAGSVVVEGCQLDPWQSAQLASSGAQAVLQTVILLCPTANDQGAVAPVEAAAQQELAQTIGQIRGMGYRARLALTMADELGNPYSPDVMQASLASATWRASVVAAAATFAQMADGLDLQLPPPPDASVDDVTRLVQALSASLAVPSLDVFVPPGGASNDVPGSAAYDLASIGPLVTRIHVLTLDYSTGTGAPGPTIDSGWAVDVERSVSSETSATLDVAVPLYGWDFGPAAARSVTFLEAQGVASQTGAAVVRGPTGALHYDWQDEGGGAHETWFDDGTSTSWTLAAWDTGTLPAQVGVVFWGLGSEDPALWSTLAQEMPR
jgi:spore germination protein YaaH